MKVLNVIHDWRFGGPQSRVIQVAPQLKARGWETIVAMPRGDDRHFASRLTSLNIPFVEFDLVRLRSSRNLAVHWHYITRVWPNVRKLRQIIRDMDIDVVHVNGIMHLQGPLAARSEGVALVWHLNEIGSPRLLQALYRPLVRRWSDVIAVSSDSVRQHYFDRGRAFRRTSERVRVVYPPVDGRRFADASKNTRLRTELGIPEFAPVIGTVGHLNPFKGVEFLIGALPIIKRAFPSAKLLIAGSELETQPDYADLLRRVCMSTGCAGDIIFLGSRADVPDVLGAMSVYVQASLSESFGMATAEASAAGLPVVATNVGGGTEVVASGVTGLLVEPRSPEAIADAVISLLREPEVAGAMGVAGAQRARELFSVDTCVDAHAATYAAAVAHSRRMRGRSKTTPLQEQL